MLRIFKSELNILKKAFKHTGNLAYTIFIIGLTFVVLFTATFAWFSMNNQVTGTGMEMSVDTVPSLVISTLNDGSANSISAKRLNTSVTFTGDFTLRPATHIASGETYTTYPSGLKYVTNLEDVLANTGYRDPNGDALTYASAANTSAKTFYVDRIVYIASANKPISNCTALYIELENISGVADTRTTSGTYNPTYSFNAATVDFYVISGVAQNATITATASNYVGSINVAGAKSGNVANSRVDLLSALGANPVIPLNTSSSIAILMRCYFDGALEDTSSSGNAYITSDLIATMAANAKISLGMKITATVPEN